MTPLFHKRIPEPTSLMPPAGDPSGMTDDPAGTRDPGDLARAHYRRIDGGAYGALRELLADDFVQHRPDMTLKGADRFVEFMREERPETDTTHVVEHVYRVTGDSSESVEADTRVAAEGRLERASGETWFRFVDIFVVSDGRLRALRTYTF